MGYGTPNIIISEPGPGPEPGLEPGLEPEPELEPLGPGPGPGPEPEPVYHRCRVYITVYHCVSQMSRPRKKMLDNYVL